MKTADDKVTIFTRKVLKKVNFCKIAITESFH